ncbi:uncharacterized protein LOC104896805 [Beta vulgaris subsp. vulgaris]|uniref:uncharacterized protein LOC104896805 n=1 Tax=Beta vulgaris subsp. vulgaris TaxID=3555 RepID=UPI002036916C|nr:uncharacterized protein LOC104896805 [Beta vulgaris subsp. vulgaris]
MVSPRGQSQEGRLGTSRPPQQEMTKQLSNGKQLAVSESRRKMDWKLVVGPGDNIPPSGHKMETDAEEYLEAKKADALRRSAQDSNAIRTFEPERFERRAGPFPYKDNIPDIIIPFIVGWNDVLGDGNCGFRCVANAFNGGEDRWPHARQNLYNEISMRQVYEFVYGGREYVDLARIRIRHTQGPTRRDHWMESVADLYVVATLYNCVVMYFTVAESGSLWGCCTILPLIATYMVTRPCYEFVIVHLGARNQHYIRLFLAPNFPVPPIALQWFALRDDSVVGWENDYATRIALWNVHYDD